jgi:hypothetical protein
MQVTLGWHTVSPITFQPAGVVLQAVDLDDQVAGSASALEIAEAFYIATAAPDRRSAEQYDVAIYTYVWDVYEGLVEAGKVEPRALSLGDLVAIQGFSTMRVERDGWHAVL